MKKALALLVAGLFLLAAPLPVYAASPLADLQSAVQSSVAVITTIGSTLAAFFIAKAGYQYMTSAGNPESIASAKKTIQRALIGLVIICSAYTFVNILTATHEEITHTPITAEAKKAEDPFDDCQNKDTNIITDFFKQDNGGLGCTLSVAFRSFIRSMVLSAIRPISDGLTIFLSATPQVATNENVTTYWKMSVGVVSVLFVLVVALIGLQFMSATTLGFEELELKQILPKLGAAFVGSIFSLYIIDSIIWFINILTKSVVQNSSSLADSWATMVFNPILPSGTPGPQIGTLITGFFLLVFLVVSAVLLLQYVSRFITIAVGTVLSPFIFLLWATPKGRDFAESAIKQFLVTLSIPVVHIIELQVASGFLNTIANSSQNPFLSIISGIGIVFAMLKTPTLMGQMIQTATTSSTYQKGMGQLMNILSPAPVGVAASTAAKSSRAIAAKSSSKPRKSKKS